MLVVEFWRSRLFPSDLAYMRSVRPSGGYVLPDAYTVGALARILADLHSRHATSQRQVRQGCGRIVRISFDARPKVGPLWRNYAERQEERNAL